jgi:predicted GNAT family N-acyltransferase/MFS family permease
LRALPQPAVAVRVASPDELPACLRLRRQVFVDEQRVPVDEELDGLDERCTHFVARQDRELVGTARMRFVGEGKAKAERVAVRASARGAGVGRVLMLALEVEAAQRGASEVVLNAQISARDFYSRLGYVPEGEEFLDAGIVHVAMRKRLPDGAPRAGTGAPEPAAGPAATGRLRLLLALWFFLYLGTLGALHPYLSVVAADAGASGAALSGLVALFPVGLLIFGPLGTLSADRSGRGLVILRRQSVLALLGLSLLALAHDWRWMFPAAAVFAFSRAPLGSLVDALTVRRLPGGARDYGAVRVWGSVGFALAAWGVGRMREEIPRAPLLAAALLLLAVVVVTFLLPAEAPAAGLGASPGGSPGAAPAAQEPLLATLRRVLSPPALRALYAVAVLHGTALSTYDHLYTLHVERLGLASRVSGAAIATGVAVEVGVLALGPWLLPRLGALALLLLGVASSAPRWWLTAEVGDAGGQALVQASHGITFGCWWVGGVALIAERAPEGTRNTAQGLFVSASHGVGTLLAMGAAAVLLDRADTATLFRWMAGLSLGTLVLAGAWLPRAARGDG